MKPRPTAGPPGHDRPMSYTMGARARLGLVTGGAAAMLAGAGLAWRGVVEGLAFAPDGGLRWLGPGVLLALAGLAACCVTLSASAGKCVRLKPPGRPMNSSVCYGGPLRRSSQGPVF